MPVRVVVSPQAGDNTRWIQTAIDYVASLPADQRGAVLLKPGRYEIAGALAIRASGIVLRGSGTGQEGTVLVATGLDRRPVIRISGKDDFNYVSQPVAILDDYVPVNAMKLKVPTSAPVKAGDSVTISRSGGGGRGGGGRGVNWSRTVKSFDNGAVTIDAPLTMGIAADGSAGTLRTFTWPGEIFEVGVENLSCESAYDGNNLKDEAHSWIGVHVENARDCWVRRVTFAHFAHAAVMLLDSTRRITVQDCKSLAPVSEIAGYRRHTFFTNGGQTLFEHCVSERGRHDFSVGYLAPGPNAFVQCEANEALEDSGPIDSMASGILYDNVRIDGHALTLGNRGYKNAGAGWSAYNCLVWQSSAALFQIENPPDSRNWAIGCWGKFTGGGVVQSSDEFVNPDSLFYGQLSDRIGREKAQARSDWMTVDNAGYTNPKLEVAAKKTEEARMPEQSLSQWIDDAAKRKPIPIDPAGAMPVEQIPVPVISPAPFPHHPISVQNGVIVADGKLVVGGMTGVQWWRGTIRGGTGAPAGEAGIAVTRYAPGRSGTGLTDDLNDVVALMKSKNLATLDHHYGLWYDQRNVDHERVRRIDGDAWPPFYEMPFARSGGNELAWDGLSKYDLTKYNPWYFDRLKQFADLCDRNGLVLYNNHFFQHNILEAGAPYASCQWRTANNINNMGFPEPPNYAGDKRIFMAEQFYDVTNTTRTKIYRAYIRKCLDNLAANSNVVHLISAEYSGPLAFTQFWIDTIAEWKKETGKKVLIGLAAPKDVQDAILADSARSTVVDVIVIRYWWYQADGQPYAPGGGQNLSPRQFTRVTPNKPSSFAQVVRAVREYRQKYADKAVVYSPWMGDGAGWASMVAGGSLPQTTDTVDSKLLAALPKMKSIEIPNAPEGQIVFGDDGQNFVVVGGASLPASVKPDAYSAHKINSGENSITWYTRN
jgi:hypothetical protein